ncbi:MAG: alpha/beta fold hydrolase [Gammaproteobacteria bacterium]|nr:MAG: alpha/beta fold hydrolase [Gammaproteobacteria bacterium]
MAFIRVSLKTSRMLPCAGGRAIAMEVRGQFERWLLGLVLLVLSMVATAETVTLEMGSGVPATAEFRNADGSGDPVLILHGFLQTRDFPTVRRLAEFLADEDHPVLTPTLSLGVPKRSQSLKCEAIHTHDLDQDVDELARWVDWLYQRMQKPVVLIGHSAGGHAITRYLARYPASRMKRVILISIAPPAGRTPAAGEPQGKGELADYALAYCRRYPTTRGAFHSYADWGAKQMIDAMAKAAVPVSVVIGGADERLEPDWRALLQKAGVTLLEVPGAGHFFDDEHEFELYDNIDTLLGGDA